VLSSASDEERAARQAALQAEAAEVLAGLDLAAVVADIGPMLLVGSYVSGLRIDLTLWLNDPHLNLTAWHESLRDTITTEQRAAVLRIKDVWHRLPSYPDQIGGTQIYTAVLDDGVRTPQEFATWLTGHGYPDA
jgi:hypothetical protein